MTRCLALNIEYKIECLALNIGYKKIEVFSAKHQILTGTMFSAKHCNVIYPHPKAGLD